MSQLAVKKKPQGRFVRLGISVVMDHNKLVQTIKGWVPSLSIIPHSYLGNDKVCCH